MELRMRQQIIFIAAVTASILMIPVVAMQFTDEVVWTLSDFLVAGVLLFGTGLTYVLIARTSTSIAYRAAVGVAVATGLILIWVNLAVGLIGSEDNPANLMYLGVLQVGVIGTAIARFRPLGMSHALYVTAVAQALVPLIALIIWRPSLEDSPGIVGVFMLNGFFVMLFVISASLFRHAGEKTRATGDRGHPGAGETFAHK